MAIYMYARDSRRYEIIYYIINIYHYRAPRVRASINLPEIAPSRRQIIVFVRTGAPRLSHIETIIYYNHYNHYNHV